jgi:hypothetical protein
MEAECKIIFKEISENFQNRSLILSLYISSKFGMFDNAEFQLEVEKFQVELKSIVVPISKLRRGSLTERSILFKHLAGFLKIPTKLHVLDSSSLVATFTVDNKDIYVDLLYSTGIFYEFSSGEFNDYIKRNLIVEDSQVSQKKVSINPEKQRLKCISTNVKFLKCNGSKSRKILRYGNLK